MCGKRPAINNIIFCNECRIKRKRLDWKNHLKQRGETEERTVPLRDIWKANGLCCRCGKPVADRLTTNGNKVSLCEKHYQKILEAQHKAVEKIKILKNRRKTYENQKNN